MKQFEVRITKLREENDALQSEYWRRHHILTQPYSDRSSQLRDAVALGKVAEAQQAVLKAITALHAISDCFILHRLCFLRFLQPTLLALFWKIQRRRKISRATGPTSFANLEINSANERINHGK